MNLQRKIRLSQANGHLIQCLFFLTKTAQESIITLPQNAPMTLFGTFITMYTRLKYNNLPVYDSATTFFKTVVIKAQSTNWICPDCEVTNVISHEKCWKCKTKVHIKTEDCVKKNVSDITAKESEIGNAPFSTVKISNNDSSWICPDCGATNIRSHEKCWKCKTKVQIKIENE